MLKVHQVVAMRINIVKSKNAEQIYIIESIKNSNGRSSSRIVQKLGTMSSLLSQFDNDREKVIEWAKEQAKILTENNSPKKVSVDFSELKRSTLGKRTQFNCGYLFLQSIFSEMELDRICSKLSFKYGFQFDLSDVLSRLIYTKIIEPSSKYSSFEVSKVFLEQPSFGLYDIYRSLDALVDNSDLIQAHLYKKIQKSVKSKKQVLYYNYTNFYFEIKEIKNNLSNEANTNVKKLRPIRQFGLLFDEDGFPLSFSLFSNHSSRNPSALSPLENQILCDFKKSTFITLTDPNLVKTAQKKFYSVPKQATIIRQSLKALSSSLIDWALNPSKWKVVGSNTLYNIKKIDEYEHYNTIFYKERWISELGERKRLVVTYCINSREYIRAIRGLRMRKIENIVGENRSYSQKNCLNIMGEYSTSSEDITKRQTEKSRSVTSNQATKDDKFDGFYAVYTTSNLETAKMLQINKQLLQNEDSFRTIKSIFRPTRLARFTIDKRLNAHFLLCFIALLFLRIIEKRLDYCFSLDEIIETLRKMELYKIDGVGYLSLYTRTKLTDKLHELFGFYTDTEFISNQTMDKILKGTLK